MTFSKKNLGFSLLELMMSLTIGMLIMATAYSVYRSAKNDQLVKETYDIAIDLFQAAQDVTMTKTVFEIDNVGGGTHDVSVGDLVNARGGIEEFPKGIVLVNTSTLGHRFGGNITISSESSNGTDKDLLALEFAGIPKGQCLQFVAKLGSSPVYDIFVNDNLVGLAPEATASSIGRSEVRYDQASQLCSEESLATIKVRQLKEIHYSKMRAGPYGSSMTPEEDAIITPLYNRQENALLSREAAQLAIP